MARPRKSNHHLPPRVYKKHGAYYFVSIEQKWTRLASIGEEQIMRTKWAEIAGPIEEAGTVSALLDQYLIDYAAKHKAPRTFKDNLTEAEYLKAYFGQMLPHLIEPRHVGAYLDVNRDKRPIRANREKALLSHMFTWAMRHQYWGMSVKTNPCKGVTRNKETKRINIVSDADYNGVYQHAERDVQRLMTLIYSTLQRPSDLLRLKVEHITQEKIDGELVDILDVEQGKTGEHVKILITPKIMRALIDKDNSPCEHLFTNKQGNPYTYDAFYTLFEEARDRYIEASIKEHGITPKKFALYDIKGKAVTEMYHKGDSLEVIQHLAGHKSVRTTEIYIKERITTPVMANTREIAEK